MTYFKTFFCNKCKKRINVFTKRITKAKHEKLCRGISRGCRVVGALVPDQLDRMETDNNDNSDRGNDSQMEVELMNSDHDDSMLTEDDSEAIEHLDVGTEESEEVDEANERHSIVQLPPFRLQMWYDPSLGFADSSASENNPPTSQEKIEQYA
ncbi:uncharacterized protein RHIMIDRAFT_242945 [Rhizopus microsporus ATCC 52813]|uniref:Uncharacterized protein n=1 Tax=Rhizopus microsporus ATCC 52813 TaxID=1340429 RepID=A0A2G4SEG4_RHIZD|nr:uncharacterized protein RHIMIDRAFT_242945 [Rhizopus microsporus ATCC 52813]PHZ07182.1 hypothetical protein RHIMIDRAFT_242945 [Rhizopus microsporus ATCC 52813]